MTTGVPTAQIPVIDISGNAPEAQIAKELVDAAATYGFVYIKNNGNDIPVDIIDRAFELSRKFFSSPIEEKAQYKIGTNNMGWSGMHTETLDEKNQRVGDFKEAMNFGEFVDGKSQQSLPPSIAKNEAQIGEFQKYCLNLCLKILELFAIGINIDAESGGSSWFTSRHQGGPSGCTLRVLYYPAIPADSDYDPAVDIRAGAHSDYGSITLLFQRPGQPGLEILPPGPSPEWTPVSVYPPGTEQDPSPPILVNIGDLLSYWTNNLFKSTVHRVVFPRNGRKGGEDRYSIAFFCHPVRDTVLEAVPSERVKALAQNVEKPVKSITADDHLQERLKATYVRAAIYETA